jgi:hypothetical protein
MVLCGKLDLVDMLYAATLCALVCCVVANVSKFLMTDCSWASSFCCAKLGVFVETASFKFAKCSASTNVWGWPNIT